ncbi:alpha/beta hydrolase [Blastococcus brunescens]|uniref:Alpha/beta hydrolase n=1 Tax=Blastococcus brunescens TaxID=1564165 RepID=A0ABZ1B2Z0_9ACTN|nr:alpha/beta hydrolase [Blastococcus sp. BMG 8361]WRL64521.1 alpha/beta hydrolase [Blastococcus sp. BMG 8361]
MSALAGDLAGLAAELLDDADTCRGAARSMTTAIEGSRGGARARPPPPGPGWRRCWQSRRARWPAPWTPLCRPTWPKTVGSRAASVIPGSCPDDGAVDHARARDGRGAARPRGLGRRAAAPRARHARGGGRAARGLAGPGGVRRARPGHGEGWSGPASRSAALAVRDLSSVTWVVEQALDGSLSALGRLGTEAAAAQEQAREALVRPERADGGEAALRHARAASAAADDAGAALAAIGRRDGVAPADVTDLGARVSPAQPVCAPSAPAGPPRAVAAWWAALPLTAQLTALRTNPRGLGGLDGVPAWARDRANRQLLTAALADPGTTPYAAFTAGVVARRIELEEAAGRRVQLHLLDLAGDRVVLGLGDLDTADAVALVVPGIHNTPGDDLGGLVGTARAVAGAARRAAPGTSVAAAVWLGYDSPSGAAQILGRRNAVAGGAALADSLAGLRAGRDAVASTEARATVLAHSYGTVVVDEAADEPGMLAADAVVLLGSPGMEEDAASLEAPEVHDAAAPDDLVAALRWFGGPTTADSFGSAELPVGPGTGHSGYYDEDRPTLAAMGRVVAGVPDPR